MTTATMKLPQKSIDWLQSLIEVNIDSRDGFHEAADNLKDEGKQFEPMFRQLGHERANQAAELQEMVSHNAEKPKHSGSVAAAAHRAWMDLRAALGGGEHAIMSEAERGEDYIKGKYEAAIEDLGSCACVPTLQRHYAAVKASHDKIKRLRDSHAKK